MLRRQIKSSIGCCFAAATADTTSMRTMSTPGWKQKVSTRDGRSREKRDADRKIRQIEKLPKCQALHDFQYPHEKTVLGDAMGQHPVYTNEFDTPHLFHHTPPSGICLYFNAQDFERSNFPDVPIVDTRLLSVESKNFEEYNSAARKLLQKHSIIPGLVPHISPEAQVNLSVVWNDPDTQAINRELEEEKKPVPEHRLTRHNYWRSAHCGNYIPLADVQSVPEIYMTVPKEKENAYYTLAIISPDYPYRTNHNEGFMLQYMVTNIQGKYLSADAEPKFEDLVKGTQLGGGAQAIADRIDGKHLQEFSLGVKSKGGEVVVPWVPPLPTEDAGTTRHMCLLFEQSGKVDKVTAPRSLQEQEKMLPFIERSNFRLHSLPHEERAKRFKSLADVEKTLGADPVAVSFFQTTWDIQVQEYYEDMDLDEPRYVHDVEDDLESQLQFLAMDPAKLRARTRMLPDGAVNTTGQKWSVVNQTRLFDGTATNFFSLRTRLGENKKKVVVPTK